MFSRSAGQHHSSAAGRGHCWRLRASPARRCLAQEPPPPRCALPRPAAPPPPSCSSLLAPRRLGCPGGSLAPRCVRAALLLLLLHWLVLPPRPAGAWLVRRRGALYYSTPAFLKAVVTTVEAIQFLTLFLVLPPPQRAGAARGRGWQPASQQRRAPALYYSTPVLSA